MSNESPAPFLAAASKVRNLEPPTKRSQRLEAKPEVVEQDEDAGTVAARLSASAGEGGEASPGPVVDAAAKPKKDKPVKPPKPPKEPKTPKERLFKKLYPDNAVIHLKVEGNPKRAGTAAHGRFALYKDQMTINDALKAGVLYADFVWDVGHGFIEVTTPAAAPAPVQEEPAPEAVAAPAATV